MPEQPLYILPQQKSRFFIPKTILLLTLSIIFYLSVLLNISLLKVTLATEDTIRLISLIILAFIIILDIIFNIIKSRQKYLFYRNKITFHKKEFLLPQPISFKLKRNLLDKIFKTYSLTLNQKFKINNISQTINLQEYIQKLISYYKKY